MVRIFVAILLALSLTGFAALADDKFGFVKSADEIVKGLTEVKPQRAIRTRSLKTPSTSSTDRNRRGIKVLYKENETDNEPVVEKVIIPQDEPAPSVNLMIGFDYDSYAIRPESYQMLNELRKALNHDALLDKTITIKGHTDSDGSETYNLKLSFNRAQAVKSFLMGNFFINENRLRVMGFGEATPLVPNITPGNKQLNRRVEIQAE